MFGFLLVGFIVFGLGLLEPCIVLPPELRLAGLSLVILMNIRVTSATINKL